MRETATFISKVGCPPGSSCSYYKHMLFINYEEFDLPNPIYISLVRHPVDRQISWYCTSMLLILKVVLYGIHGVNVGRYYYLRSSKYVTTHGGPTLPLLKVSLNDCVTGR